MPTVEKDGIDALLGDGADCGAFHRRNAERAGQRRQRYAAVGIGRGLEIIADQLELGVARARVDEVVEQLGESAHAASTRPQDGSFVTSVQAGGDRGEDRGAICLRPAAERIVETVAAALRGDPVPGQQRQLRRAIG